MTRFLLAFFALLFLPAAALADENDPRPYDENYDAMEAVDFALAEAERTEKRLLLVLGANWCHDSRGLAGHFQDEELAATLAAHYHLLHVDVGWRDRNQDVPRRFGVPAIYGTPTVLIIDPVERRLLNGDSVHDWRAADSVPIEEVRAYFADWAQGDGPAREEVLAAGSNIYQALMIEIDIFEEEEAARLARAYVDVAAWREMDRADRPANFQALESEVERWRRNLPRQIASLRQEARDKVERGIARHAGPNGPDARAVSAFDASDADVHVRMRPHESEQW
jgi:hypothetical protein